MPIIKTHELTPETEALLSPQESRAVYCGLDTMVTREVRDELAASHGVRIGQTGPGNDPSIPIEIYAFSRALQGSYLEIMQRGFAIDELARQAAIRELALRRDAICNDAGTGLLDYLSSAICDYAVNPRSWQQLQDLFYTRMLLPEVWISMKGERKLTTNREALEKLEQYIHARPLVALILSFRDVVKQLQVLESEVDDDGRMRSSYNIAGTNSGRPSSSSNAFGTGCNLQNIDPRLRNVFIADQGYKLAVIDLSQVEARDVGFFCGCLFNQWGYLDACESNDLHVATSKLVWPGLGWAGDAKRDRQIADQNFYRDFSYRDMAKRGSHLSNYHGSAWMGARALKIPQHVMEEFHDSYFGAYPEIPQLWQWIAQELQTKMLLVTPFKRRRHFFGRIGDDATLREAIAFLPQSTTADRTNLGLWRVWRHMRDRVQLLAQTYDSITFQYRDKGHDYESAIIADALGYMNVELTAPNGRKYSVPGEAKIGWNWGNCITTQDQQRARNAGKRIPKLNVEGLAKWSPSKPDSRIRVTGINRVMVA